MSFWQLRPIFSVTLGFTRSPHELQRAPSRQQGRPSPLGHPVRVVRNEPVAVHVPPIVTCLPATSTESVPVDVALVTRGCPESSRKWPEHGVRAGFLASAGPTATASTKATAEGRIRRRIGTLLGWAEYYNTYRTIRQPE